MITTLLFDFGSTLDGPAYWLDRFVAQYRIADIPVTRAELDPAYEHARQATSRARRVVERFGFTELVRMLVGQQIEFLAETGPEAIRATLRALDSRGRYRVGERITALFVEQSRSGMQKSLTDLEALKPRYRIGVVSNWYGNLDRIIAEAGMAKLVGAVADSARLGFGKPDPRIFQAALKSLGAAPAQAAMIGDSLEKDCVPARGLGLKTVWYCPMSDTADWHARRDQGSASADYVVADLEEIAELKL
ncbi:MAG: HAD family hydrolase [Candidatus Binataceae bacterium]